MTCLYAIGGINGPIKIGFSNNPYGRIPVIKNASPVPIEFQAIYDVGDMHKEIERTVHLVLRGHRSNGEWFYISPDEAIDAIQKTSELLQICISEKKRDEPIRHVVTKPVFKPTYSGQKRGPKPSGRAKQLVSLRIDPDVLSLYRSTGDGWQSRLNSDLRKAVGL